MQFTYTIARSEVTVAFPAKPADDVRAMLKANGFRWSSQAGLWWRRRVEGAADFLEALERKLNPGRPDGACWECKDPAGFFRPMGAAAPVLCKACYAKREHFSPYVDKTTTVRETGAPFDRTDLDYEDDCARACGL